MDILNCYPGGGGNRKLWTDCHVTAVEIDPRIAKVYQDYFPNDKVIVGDAHKYLLEHYREFDFIWSSPPCPTHSRMNTMANANGKRDPKYIDVKLYQEIILLKHWFDGKWLVENVIPYYEPLIPGEKIARHMFWSNFKIGTPDIGHLSGDPVRLWNYKDYEREYGYDLSGYGFGGFERRKILRNMVHPEIGKYILDRARGIIHKSNTTQMELI